MIKIIYILPFTYFYSESFHHLSHYAIFLDDDVVYNGIIEHRIEAARKKSKSRLYNKVHGNKNRTDRTNVTKAQNKNDIIVLDILGTILFYIAYTKSYTAC